MMRAKSLELVTVYLLVVKGAKIGTRNLEILEEAWLYAAKFGRYWKLDAKSVLYVFGRAYIIPGPEPGT